MEGQVCWLRVTKELFVYMGFDGRIVVRFPV